MAPAVVAAHTVQDLANLAAGLVRSSGRPEGGLLARIAGVAILSFSAVLALQQIAVATRIVNLAFGLLLGSIAVAAALAFGLGGREAAAKQWRSGMEQLRPKRQGTRSPSP